jgi:hypothetical protein
VISVLETDVLPLTLNSYHEMVGEDGFEPPKDIEVRRVYSPVPLTNSTTPQQKVRGESRSLPASLSNSIVKQRSA